jgi:hypothetical protein
MGRRELRHAEGRHIEKIEALAVTAGDFRPTAIEFFAASQLGNAKRWLST